MHSSSHLCSYCSDYILAALFYLNRDNHWVGHAFLAFFYHEKISFLRKTLRVHESSLYELNPEMLHC